MSRDLRLPTPTVEAIGKLHLEGNIVPHTFYARKEFKSAKGITQHIAILIYADDLYWYRPTIHRDELTGQVTHVTRKFEQDMLQRSYEYYAELFGISKQQATDAVKFNVERGLTRREFRTIRGRDGKKISNVMFVEPVVGALRALLELEKGDGSGWHWVAEPPRPNLKKERGEGIPNKTDTYPEHSGYLSQVEARRTRSIRDTNTENTQETFEETSSKKNSSSISEQVVDASPADDDEKSADARKDQNPTPDAPHSPGQGQTPGQGGGTHPAPGVENVPRAAGGGGAAAGESAILALQPIPRAELEARAARDPEGMKTLRALMQATNPGRLGHLREQLALNTVGTQAIPRALLLRLTDAEIETARKAAQADAKIVKGGMGSAGYYALDALIGEQFTLERLTGQPPVRGAAAEQPMHRSHRPLNNGQVVQETEPPATEGRLRVGAMWRSKKDGKLVLIRAAHELGKYALSDGTQVNAVDLNRLYTFEAAPSEASA